MLRVRESTWGESGNTRCISSWLLTKKSRALELHAIAILDGLPRLDAHHDILRVGVVLAEVVTVVGRHQRQAEVFFQPEQAGMNPAFLLETLILNFQEEILRAENIAIGGGRLAGGVQLVFHQPFRDFALQAPGEPDQALAVFGQKLLADPRLVVKTVQRSFRSDLGQVAIAFFVFRQHQEMVIGIAFGRRALDVVVFLLADVQFAAHDGLHSRLLRRIHKVHRAEDIAVVGHGDRGHTQFLHPLAEFLHVAGAVEHGIVGMEMKMNELGHGLEIDSRLPLL